MITARRQSPLRIAESIAKICAAHELSRDTLARLLAITGEQLAAWEAGDAILPAVTAHLHKLDRDLSFVSLAAWKRRIELSAGRELLVGRDLRVVAITKAAFRPPTDPTKVTGVAAIAIHHDYRSLLPIRSDITSAPRGAVLTKLESLGFFEGRIRRVRADVELNYGAFAYCGVWEIWPLATLDAGIVAHLVFHPHAATGPTRTSSGIVLRQVEISHTDTEGAFNDMRQEQERAESSR